MADFLQLGDVRHVALPGIDLRIVAVVIGIDDTMKLLQICLATIQDTTWEGHFIYPFGEQVVVTYPNVLLNVLWEQLGDDLGVRLSVSECERLQDAHLSFLTDNREQNILLPPADVAEVAMIMANQFREWLEGSDACHYFDIPALSATTGWSSETCRYFAALLATRDSYNMEERHLQELIRALQLFGDEPGHLSDPIVGAILQRLNNSRFIDSDGVLPGVINHDLDGEMLLAFDRAGLRTIDELTADSTRKSRGRLVPGTSRFVRFREWTLPDDDEIRWSR